MHYVDLLRSSGQAARHPRRHLRRAQSRFNNPVNLKQLINLIDETEWTTLDVDVKAAAYEGLLEKAASEGKKGAGQYFTPRVLIQSIVRCMKPDPRVRKDFTICDPACGTGGFLVAAYEWLIGQTKGGALDRDIAKRIRPEDLLRPGPRRPAAPPGPDEPLPARPRAQDRPRRHDLRGPVVRPLRRDPHQPALRHQGGQPGPGPRRLHRRHQQQAAQLRPARPDHPQARRPRRRGPARQLPLRRPGRRGLQDSDARTATCTRFCACPAARSPRTARA